MLRRGAIARFAAATPDTHGRANCNWNPAEPVRWTADSQRAPGFSRSPKRKTQLTDSASSLPNKREPRLQHGGHSHAALHRASGNSKRRGRNRARSLLGATRHVAPLSCQTSMTPSRGGRPLLRNRPAPARRPRGSMFKIKPLGILTRAC